VNARAVIFALGTLAFSAQALHAQYGQVMDRLAGQEEAGVAASIRFLAVAAGSLAPEIGEEEARAAVRTLGVVLPDPPADRPISYGEFAFLAVQFFDIPGGFFYGLFPGPMTAFRDLQARGLIPADARAGDRLSGAKALMLMDAILQSRGGSE
jgi:hypothetical protein